MSSNCWFDIAYQDIEKIKTFYSGLFGWKVEKRSDDPEYWGIITPENMQPPGPMIGGFVHKQHPGHRITSYFSVANCDESAKKVIELGGTVLSEPADFGPYGRCAIVCDPEGNEFALWQTSMS